MSGVCNCIDPLSFKYSQRDLYGTLLSQQPGDMILKVLENDVPDSRRFPEWDFWMPSSVLVLST